MVCRIFHPIGQGAFYSERHNGFNVVYDCGSWRDSHLSDKVVRQAFSKGEEIDILFVSHFDYDHISKIRTLKEHTRIKKVILPLLHESEKNLIINIYRLLNFNILTLIENPEDFFGDETEVIVVLPSENPEAPIENTEPVDMETLRGEIVSGTILKKVFNTYNWIYIPYNYDYENRNSQLEQYLEEDGFDVEKMKEDPNYTIRNTINREQRKRIKDIYSKVEGNINQNSMIVYSGVMEQSYGLRLKACFSYSDIYHIPFIDLWESFAFGYIEESDILSIFAKNEELFSKIRYRISSIYTGDTNLNVVKIKSIFKQYWDRVGTIQIPHHGDIKSFDRNVLNNRHFFCPISFGKKNSYGHPSAAVVADIICQESYPIYVTEDLNSAFVQVIDIK